MLAFEIEHLAADHALDGARSFRDELHDADCGVRRTTKRTQDGVGECLQGVAGEDGDGFSVNYVTGGLAAAEIVVVERGQIVVDE